jgi:hypothetical protein
MANRTNPNFFLVFVSLLFFGTVSCKKEEIITSNGQATALINGGLWESEYAEVLSELQSGNCIVTVTTNDDMVYYSFYTPESETVPMYVLPIQL